jgi:hypothetical protein
MSDSRRLLILSISNLILGLYFAVYFQIQCNPLILIASWLLQVVLVYARILGLRLNRFLLRSNAQIRFHLYERRLNESHPL